MSSVLYRTSTHNYPEALKANGLYIKDRQGKSYLDMSGGAAVSSIGHGNPHVLERMNEQLSAMSFAHTAFFTNGPQEELAERLAARFSEPGARVYFSSGGSEANETAIKLAWQYWALKDQPNKKIIISRNYSYHGNTFGTLSISGNRGRRKKSYAPLLDWPRIDPCYAYRHKMKNESELSYSRRAASCLEEAIVEHGADHIAAFICEPVVGSSLGAVEATEGYLGHIRAICDKHDILLITDEIMCGSGRTGTYFAHEQDNIVPDIVTLAKGIAGGYQPLSATLMRKHISDIFDKLSFSHGHTYIGHPMSCVAGCAVMDEIERLDLLTKAQLFSDKFKQCLNMSIASLPFVGDIRGRGLLMGVECVSNKETKDGFPLEYNWAAQLRNTAMQEGLICYPGHVGINGHSVPHILLAPPLILEDIHIEECCDKLNRVLRTVFNDYG